MRRSFAAALATVVCCSPASAGPATAPGSIDPAQRTFGCSGSIFRALSKSSLAAAYGASNVSVEKVIGAEGESVTMETAVFAKRPTEKIRIEWSDKANKIVSGVEVFGSKWVGPARVHVGSTIAELEQANGKPFTFSGLGWDYGGLVKDWRGGALGPVKPTRGGPGNLPPDCRMDVELTSAPSAPEAATAAVSGEQDFKSNDPKVAAAHIIVAKITFYYGN
jgi:hypothetical protein